MDTYEKKLIDINNLKEQYRSAIKQIKNTVKQGKFEEALELCKQKQFENDLLVLSIRIDCLIQLGRLDEAEEIYNHSKFLNNHFMEQYRLIFSKNKSNQTSQKPVMEETKLLLQETMQTNHIDQMNSNPSIQKQIVYTYKLNSQEVKNTTITYIQ